MLQNNPQPVRQLRAEHKMEPNEQSSPLSALQRLAIRLQATAARLAPSVRPIFHQDERGRPDIVGSSLLM